MSTIDQARAEIDHEHIKALCASLRAHGAFPATYYDERAEAYGVTVNANGSRWDVPMPADGAVYPLWRDDQWHGGIGLKRGDATVHEVASAIAARVNH